MKLSQNLEDYLEGANNKYKVSIGSTKKRQADIKLRERGEKGKEDDAANDTNTPEGNIVRRDY